MSKVIHAGGKEKSEKVHEPITPSSGHVPPPTAVTTADEGGGGVEEYFAKKSVLKSVFKY